VALGRAGVAGDGPLAARHRERVDLRDGPGVAEALVAPTSSRARRSGRSRRRSGTRLLGCTHLCRRRAAGVSVTRAGRGPGGSAHLVGSSPWRARARWIGPAPERGHRCPLPLRGKALRPWTPSPPKTIPKR
jgi:hypothetical protein